MKIETEKLTQNQIKNLSPLVLAFIGDGVHTIFVRDFVVKSKLEKLNDYNKDCSFTGLKDIMAQFRTR